MDTIDELDLVVEGQKSRIHNGCDVQHNAPVVFFSMGGYNYSASFIDE